MPIEHLIVVDDKNSVPPDLKLIDVDLNMGAGGKYLYFAYEEGDDKPPITDIAIIWGRHENIRLPINFEKIPVDLNEGAGGDYIYACIRRGVPPPITALDVIVGDSDDIQPNDPRFLKIPVDLNKGAGGKYIFLCYTKEASVGPLGLAARVLEDLALTGNVPA